MKALFPSYFRESSRARCWCCCLLCLVAHLCNAQGTVGFSNVGAQPILNSLTGLPAEPANSFSVSLYFAHDGIIDESSFAQVGPTIHLLRPGIFSAPFVTAPILPPGGFGMFQVRVWETIFGATYEQAAANRVPEGGRLALAGESGIMRVDTGDPTVYQLPASLLGHPPGLVAVVGAPLRDGFVLTVVPEPSTWALLVLSGISATWAIRRERRKW